MQAVQRIRPQEARTRCVRYAAIGSELEDPDSGERPQDAQQGFRQDGTGGRKIFDRNLIVYRDLVGNPKVGHKPEYSRDLEAVQEQIEFDTVCIGGKCVRHSPRSW